MTMSSRTSSTTMRSPCFSAAARAATRATSSEAGGAPLLPLRSATSASFRHAVREFLLAARRHPAALPDTSLPALSRVLPVQAGLLDVGLDPLRHPVPDGPAPRHPLADVGGGDGQRGDGHHAHVGVLRG